MWSMASGRAVLRQCVVCLLVAAFCTATFYLVVSTDNVSFRVVEETRSGVVRLTVVETESGRQFLTSAAPDLVDIDAQRQTCRPLLKGVAIQRDRTVSELPPASITVGDYVRLATTDCDSFRSRLGYFTAADTTAEELAFPIAFSLLTYENMEQTERLLRLVYRPHNAYCIHVDWKADPTMHRQMEAVAACLPNVMIARPSINVTWGEITVVQAELLCMGYLLANSACAGSTLSTWWQGTYR